VRAQRFLRREVLGFHAMLFPQWNELTVVLKKYELPLTSDLRPCFVQMRARVVDDVQVACYYQKVPRVSLACLCTVPVGLGNLRHLWVLGKSWLSSEEIRLRLGSMRPKTPSLKCPAKTTAPRLWETREAMQEKQTKRSASGPKWGWAWRHRRRRQSETGN